MVNSNSSPSPDGTYMQRYIYNRELGLSCIPHKPLDYRTLRVYKPVCNIEFIRARINGQGQDIILFYDSNDPSGKNLN
jgi:hypothetical protein